MIYSDGQVARYLEKLDYAGGAALCGDTLCALQSAHLQHIPYENLDILRGRPLDLTPEGLYRKIIGSPRGGYCFELNGLYSNLLQSLGFQVTNHAARFTAEGHGGMRRHRVLAVTCPEGAFLCDVGVREESPRRALALQPGLVQQDGVSRYRLERDAFFGWVLWRQPQGKGWRPVYGFTEEPQQDVDFVMPSFYCERHPASPFIRFPKLSIFTPDCNITLVDRTLKWYRRGRVEQTRQLAAGEVLGAARQYFGIVMEEDAP